MSREIKFRVWDKDRKEFVYISGTDEGFWINDGISTTVMPNHSSNLEQYTGLKDKNGKEIYEGDIVTLEYDLENVEPEDCSVITFSGGCFRVGDGYENEAGSYLSDYWQVIGNIHENPELLGGKE